jgi:hypothetical protein
LARFVPFMSRDMAPERLWFCDRKRKKVSGSAT